MKKRRYADGGVTVIAGGQPMSQDPALSANPGASSTYPFPSNSSTAGTSNNTTTNVSVGQPTTEFAPVFKKGGVVRGRGDGICQRGHTRGKMR